MKRNQKGFTLIELLVVMAIIGILAAIAIPNFAAYRARGFDARAKSDLYNMATAQEAYFLDNEVYVECNSVDNCEAALEGFRGSADVVLAAQLVDAGAEFTGTASHPKGTGVTCTWDSQSGGFQGCDAGAAPGDGD